MVSHSRRCHLELQAANSARQSVRNELHDTQKNIPGLHSSSPSNTLIMIFHPSLALQLRTHCCWRRHNRSVGRRAGGFVPGTMPYSRHTCPSLKLHVLCHYPCCQLQWDCSEATATLQGPQASGRGQTTFWSTAGMNGLAASRASCCKLYQHAAPTDGSPLEKPPAAARVALTPAFCSPCARWHEKWTQNMHKGQNHI